MKTNIKAQLQSMMDNSNLEFMMLKRELYLMLGEFTLKNVRNVKEMNLISIKS